MPPLKAIFFDAGNTLVFPDLRCTLAPLLACGVEPAREQLFAAERAARQQRDAAAAAGQKLGDRNYWEIFYSTLLRNLELDGGDGLLPALVAATQNSLHWNQLRPGTREALLALGERYTVAVISNSDGRMAKLLEGVGLGGCFASVTDSSVVGHEKPDARIFQAALRGTDVAAADALYVGDIYSVDYLGATGAGMQAMLFDVCGAYRETELPRVESMAELVERLLRG